MNSQSDRSTPKIIPHAAGNAPTILIVDDDPVSLSVLFNYLNAMDFKMLVARDGESAIEQARTVIPDLILLDILMPEMDGFEVCRRLKTVPETRTIPIFFMTALSNVRDLVTGFELGAVDYITKPFSPEEILARVTTHLTLQQQQQELRDLNAAKNRFFTIVTHDMKEVLSTLVSLSDFMVMSAAETRSAHIEKAAQMVERSVHNAIKLLENLSCWVDIQNGTCAYHPEILDLYEIVLENIVLLRSPARKKRIDLSHSIQAQTLVYSDYDMMSLVIRNLLVNALWFTPSGGSVSISAADAERFVEVSVADTGIGISPEQLNQLFRIDHKFRRHGTNGEQGTGLGLVLCKDFVEMNGGHIWVNSHVGEGSTFTFSLPRQRT